MTDHPSTDTTTNTSTDDHRPPSVDRSFATLAPTVRTIAFDAVPPRDRSLPVALCLNAGAVAAAIDDDARAIDPRTDDRLEPVTNAVALLEGYVRIRADLLADRDGAADRRDAAVLASDFLHAAAYEPIAAAPVPERRTLELYRTLAVGSSTLAARFARSADEPAADALEESNGNEMETCDESGTDRPNATLAATAAALGAAATGASSDVRAALETYARSLSAALRTRAGALPENADAEPRDAAVRVLSGRAGVGDGEPELPARGGADVVARTPSATTVPEPAAASSSVAALEHNLERAREALATLEDLAASTADRAPLARLERATRIPFRHEE